VERVTHMSVARLCANFTCAVSTRSVSLGSRLALLAPGLGSCVNLTELTLQGGWRGDVLASCSWVTTRDSRFRVVSGCGITAKDCACLATLFTQYTRLQKLDVSSAWRCVLVAALSHVVLTRLCV